MYRSESSPISSPPRMLPLLWSQSEAETSDDVESITKYGSGFDSQPVEGAVFCVGEVRITFNAEK